MEQGFARDVGVIANGTNKQDEMIDESPGDTAIDTESFTPITKNGTPTNRSNEIGAETLFRASSVPVYEGRAGIPSNPTSQGHDSPLFVSERSVTPNISLDEQPPSRGRLSVIVPTVERPWEYRVYSSEPKIKGVIKELDHPDGLRYLVKYRRGGKAEVSFGQLVRLSGGPAALDRFNNSSTTRSCSSISDASDTVMVSARQAQSRRQRDTGFVDISKVDLSEDEDDDELDTLKASKSRLTRKRGLLSAPRLPLHNKASDSGTSSSDPTSASEAGDSETSQSHRHDVIRLNLRTRSTTNGNVNYNEYRTEDESGSDEIHPRLTKRRRISTQDAEGQQTRKFERIGRASRSMREKGEDDIPEVVSSKPGSKAVGAREHFKDLPKSNDFRLRHCQTCDTCGDHSDNPEKGHLVFCQGCTLSYHKNCLGPRNNRDHLVTKVGDMDFVLQCRRCIGTARRKDPTAPQQGKCQECHEEGKACKSFRDRKTSKQEQKEREENDGKDPMTEVGPELINNVGNVLFRCMGCYRAFHMHHLPPRSDKGIMEGADENEHGIERFSEYCRDWSCEQCSMAPAEIESLVAWRPVDEDSYTVGQSTELVDEDDKEYLIKWKKLSYFRCSWMPGAWVWGMTAPAMRKAFGRRDNGNYLPKMRSEDAFPEEYLRVDVVLDVKYTNLVNTHVEEVEKARVKEVAKALVKFKGLGYEDVVWEEPPDPEDVERWADFKSAYEDWVLGRYVHQPVQHNLKLHLEKVRAQKFESKIMMKAQPSTLTGGKLMPFQMEGLNWLLYQWHRGQNAILADEMGLGKTIQVIGFLSSLQQVHRCWPFLIVVPNSTCANWRREIKQWAPSLRVVSYFGSAEARRLAYKYELFPAGAKDLRCHIVVTSYEAGQDESCFAFFRKVPWAGLIVDEGQRLSNDKALLYGALKKLKAPFAALLTGTPLQNNPRELFNLLQFLDTSIDAKGLEEKYATLTKENVPQLHELLRPFFLRRTKAQVLTFLPPMAQIIVPVTLSTLQKELYKSILSKNSELMKAIFGGDKKLQKMTALRNLLMQLRKCLCHPFVYSRAIEEQSSNAAVSHRSLVEASSKLQLLEIMLPKLQERGHRVLIFSQFLDMLDMVEDFLDGLGMFYQRLDGNTGSLQKQKRIDEFNTPNSPLFAFLLSTRAGGVGINLATADTVIVLDPDFNPHRDIQAFSRAHRIGQEKKVLVFQLMTRGTAEEKIMQMGKRKMALDHVLIEQMDADEGDGNDLESVLRFGAEAIFKDDDSHDIRYDSSSVDKLLDRTQIENTETGKDGSAESQFSFARVWANDKGVMEDGLGTSSDDNEQIDASVWEKILEERAREAAREAASRTEALGRGKRKRQTIDYTRQTVQGVGVDSPAKHSAADSDSDTDFQARGAESDGDDSVPEDDEQIMAEELQSPPSRKPRSEIVPEGSRVQPRTEKFRRIRVPPNSSQEALPKAMPCVVCNDSQGPHPVGHCPLKAAGVEYCNLCGLAHYGIGRACPHLASEIQCRQMLAAIKESNEPKEHKDAAKLYLRGVIGDLVRRKKEKTAKGQAVVAQGLHQPNMLPATLNAYGQSLAERGFSAYRSRGKEISVAGSVNRPPSSHHGREVWEV